MLAEKFPGKRGKSGRSEDMRTSGFIVGAVLVLLLGRVGLEASISVSPKVIEGSEEGKDPIGLVGVPGGSDSSIGSELLAIMLRYMTSRPGEGVFAWFIIE